jgi:Mg-chelatase subunit ChlD
MSLVSFADEAVRHVSATPLTPRGRAAVEKQVRGLATRGSTNLFDGWLDGCQAVAERQATCRSPERHHVVLLSDGHANQGIVCPEALARHAGELRARGIVTSPASSRRSPRPGAAGCTTPNCLTRSPGS